MTTASAQVRIGVNQMVFSTVASTNLKNQVSEHTELFTLPLTENYPASANIT